MQPQQKLKQIQILDVYLASLSPCLCFKVWCVIARVYNGRSYILLVIACMISLLSCNTLISAVY